MKLNKLLISISIVLLSFIAVNIMDVYATTATKLVVHYHRYDNDIDAYDLWLWPHVPTSGAGDNFAFNGSDSYGKTSTITIPGSILDGSTTVGFLVKKEVNGVWTKDIDEDRFIDMSNPNGSGEVHVYLLQGESFVSYVSESAVDCDLNTPDPYKCAQEFQSAILSASFDGNNKLNFTLTDSVTSSNIIVKENGVSVPFSGFSSGTSGQLTLTNGVDLSNTYTIEVDINGQVKESVVVLDVDFDSVAFANAYNYDGPLGMEYTNTQTTFRIWAPLSSSASLNLYTAGHNVSVRSDGADTPYAVHDLSYQGQGMWEAVISGDLDGVYYTYNVVNDGSLVKNIQDPYGVTFGLNGQRSMVVDLDSTDPVGWDVDSGIDGYANVNEAIIYELHVRDLTSQTASWGGTPSYSGKYMGITERGTSYTNPNTNVTVSTGLDHLIELGITHLHLLPTYDQDGWNNEDNFAFNWGYNPQHFNSPEGGYSTDPFDGKVRVNEYKQMVMALHDNGINVINDVVYNHVADAGSYSFNKLVPGYFFRIDDNGVYSNGTGVGNETASERYMVNKFIRDSVKYWAEEYHIDGFRFDLMAVHDVTVMNQLASELELIDEDIFVYGEPWGGGTIALDYNQQAGKNNISNMPLISAFNDNYRNALKGSPDGSDAGYITSGDGIYDIMKGIKGSIDWGWGNTSSQSINYVTAHDNLTLYDKLRNVHGSSGYTEEIDYEARFANSVVLLSQGVPFLHAGVDFLRTKGGDHNSYDAPDSVNQLNWVRKANNVDSFEYYKGIIEIRKEYDSFKMVEKSDIDANLNFLYPDGYGLIGYRLTKNFEDILVYHNGGKQANDIVLPVGAWKLLSNRSTASLDGIATYETRYPIEEAETLIFVKGNINDVIPSPGHKPEITNTISILIEGGTFRLKSNTLIDAYKIDNGEWVTVESPAYEVFITGLTVGSHTVTMRDAVGTMSDAFEITVLENQNAEKTCDEDPNQEKCEVNCELTPEDPSCEVNCTLTPDDPACELVCNENEVIVEGECVVPNTDDKKLNNTGCFGSLKSPMLIVLSTIVGGLFIVARRRNI